MALEALFLFLTSYLRHTFTTVLAFPPDALQYDYTFDKIPNGQTVFFNMTGSKHSVTGMTVSLERRISPLVNSLFLPSASLVGVSSTSFFIPYDCIAGRMSLLMNSFIMNVNMALSARQGAPVSKVNTWLDVWLTIIYAATVSGKGYIIDLNVVRDFLF